MASILLVEDDDIVMQVTASLLQAMGYTVTEAENGLQALDAVLSPLELDLALVDLSLPDMDGLDLASQIHDHRPNLKIILCTGGMVERSRLREKGIAGVLFKPFDHALMEKTIQEVLR